MPCHSLPCVGHCVQLVPNWQYTAAPGVPAAHSNDRCQPCLCRPAPQHRHKYAEADSRLNNRDIFDRFVLEWINSSAGQLSLRCRRLEQGMTGQHGWQEFATDGEADRRLSVVTPVCNESLKA